MEDVELRSDLGTFQRFLRYLKSYLWTESEMSSKKQINWGSLKIMALFAIATFLLLVLILPSEQDVGFSQQLANDGISVAQDTSDKPSRRTISARNLWESPRNTVGGSSSQSDRDTPMILNSEFGNAKTQIRAGYRLPVRILERFVVSETAIPVMAEIISDAESPSGLKIPAGSKLYGDAFFQRGQTRAQINFNQLSYPSGEIKRIAFAAMGKDGQLGIDGNVRSDSTRNTTGSVITSFVAGFANGSVETDIFGGSRGGVTNGILSAVGSTAKERANAYGEKLKTEREWIEVETGAECDAVLKETLDFQNGNRR